MSMTKLITSVQELVKQEYERAAAQYGPAHASQHEAYAVMREEFQEAVEEMNKVGELIEERFWQNVRNNDTELNEGVADVITAHAVLCACECIQTAAMAVKSLYHKEESNAE